MRHLNKSGNIIFWQWHRQYLYDTDSWGYLADLHSLDFQNAFDKIPHDRLKVKVNAHGIQGDAARWICYWLVDDAKQKKKVFKLKTFDITMSAYIS